MIEVFPNYYEKFKCIADRCKHSCCKGWEIQIDEDTMELYGSLQGELADKIRSCIEGDEPHFRLDDEERCPFLNHSGLCDIICEYGDGALCDICYLHPRFTNFYENFEETGLGLCCEEVVRILVSETEKFVISPPYNLANNDEKVYLEERQKIFDVLQNRSLSIGERFKKLWIKYCVDFDFSVQKVYNIYENLERLDEKWTNELEKLKSATFDDDIFDEYTVLMEQLACYFIFRHFKQNTDYQKSVWFAVLSCYVIANLLVVSNGDFEAIADIIRMYSSEIEYSEENMAKILK